jgi:hypothetical protein
MKMRILFLLCAALALTVGVATATAGNGHGKGKGGNSAAAKACQKGGWKNWVRADQTPFKNTGDCVSYAARGGVLTAPKTQSQLDCEAFGGTFGTSPVLVGSFTTVLWVCNGWTNTDITDFNTKLATLQSDCTADGGVLNWAAVIPGPGNSTCGIL